MPLFPLGEQFPVPVSLGFKFLPAESCCCRRSRAEGTADGTCRTSPVAGWSQLASAKAAPAALLSVQARAALPDFRIPRVILFGYRPKS